MNYKEKLQQANKEAKAALVALVLTVLVWIVSGFGVAPLNIVIFNTPLWIITGCFGTWIFAVIAAVVMSKYVFKDIDLGEEVPAEMSGVSATAAASSNGEAEVSHITKESKGVSDGR